MRKKVTYYKMFFPDDPPDQLGGLARRIQWKGGLVDEALHKDLQWHPSTSISGWERGEVSQDLVEISEAEAERIIERFRQRFGS